MSWRPHPKRADTDPDYPQSWGTDDQSGFVTNLHKMRWQMQWAGNQLINLRYLVHPDFLDEPQEQLRTLIIPVDPPPLFNTRPEPYEIDETNWRTTQDGDMFDPTGIRETQDDELRVTNSANPDTAPTNTDPSGIPFVPGPPYTFVGDGKLAFNDKFQAAMLALIDDSG